MTTMNLSLNVQVDGAVPINNFTTDWNDGRAIGALVDSSHQAKLKVNTGDV